MKQIKLEVGKTYRNRRGEEVKITGFAEGIQYPCKGSKGMWYRVDGRWANKESPYDLIEELPEPRYTFIPPDDMKEVTSTRYTFTIPGGMTKLTVEQVSNRIIVEMVPEAKTPKPGDVMVNANGSVYIFKEVRYNGESHEYFACLCSNGRLAYNNVAVHGRPATPEEAQPLWDALKKAGKRWNSETMQVEDVPEIERILEWVETNIKEGYYNHEDVAEAIEGYLKQKEAKK